MVKYYVHGAWLVLPSFLFALYFFKDKSRMALKNYAGELIDRMAIFIFGTWDAKENDQDKLKK